MWPWSPTTIWQEGHRAHTSYFTWRRIFQFNFIALSISVINTNFLLSLWVHGVWVGGCKTRYDSVVLVISCRIQFRFNSIFPLFVSVFFFLFLLSHYPRHHYRLLGTQFFKIDLLLIELNPARAHLTCAQTRNYWGRTATHRLVFCVIEFRYEQMSFPESNEMITTILVIIIMMHQSEWGANSLWMRWLLVMVLLMVAIS